ncbi:MAG: ATP/GTP-binding protein [Lachnospiraceae bacterium]|nr:ATP/GTP-binding protein [Lachnospiraceae bacterium]
MLIRFNVKNFLSFSAGEDGKSEEFSMIAGKVRNKKEHIYDDNKIKLLKFAAVYGANASGKSNLVKALDFMRDTVVYGLPDGYSGKYCKADEGNKELPSYFEVEVKLGKKYYSYGYEVILSKGEFLSEWLVELISDNKEKTIFSRDISKGLFRLGGGLKTKGLFEKVNNYAEDIQDDGSTLLLTVMNHNKKNLYQNYKRAAVLQDMYLWLKNALDINYPDMPISSYSYMADTDNVEEICNMIAAFGTGITDYKMVDVPVERVLSHLPEEVREQVIKKLERHMVEAEKNFKNQSSGIFMRSSRDFFVLEIKNEEIICQTIQFEHSKKNILFGLSEESDGTVRILDLLEILLSDEGKTYVIDELDRCLHPSLTYKFIETFLQLIAKKNIQLIVTTHESRLLDFDLLRRDEIWFVNKRKTGESDIYSLEEYNTRFDQKIDKAYLEGRYGGVPIFSTVFPIKEV